MGLAVVIIAVVVVFFVTHKPQRMQSALLQEPQPTQTKELRPQHRPGVVVTGRKTTEPQKVGPGERESPIIPGGP